MTRSATALRSANDAVPEAFWISCAFRRTSSWALATLRSATSVKRLLDPLRGLAVTLSDLPSLLHSHVPSAHQVSEVVVNRDANKPAEARLRRRRSEER